MHIRFKRISETKQLSLRVSIKNIVYLISAKGIQDSYRINTLCDLHLREGFAWDKPTTTTTPRGPTTTEDIAIFEKGGKVELQIPDELFGSGFTLITNLSQTAGDLIINTALRTQRVLESMRPLLRAIFGAKGIVIEASTDKPIFSAPNSSSK
ncbi:hypothetical protein WA026_009668 [Henosepilachna vigintioctopunctata]|uniref:Uncharacterized protein n=1 Tax=Henosepilachna vigintioctopunctata TaxID=420089 RepID=A0AAW1U7H8_9CUCU